MTMLPISQTIDTVLRDLASAVAGSGKPPGATRLLAVSKTRSVDEVTAAIECGLREFGENFVQEAVPKITAIDRDDVVWHFIGAIQSNKTRELARYFQWVHTIDRPKIADRLSQARAENPRLPPLDVCLQVNVDREPQKAGVAPDGLTDLVAYVSALPHLSLRGLMAIPTAREDPELMRPSFAELARLFHAHEEMAGDNWDTLSMGMTNDFRVAIEEGATIVRIGTAIFGPRQTSARSEPSHEPNSAQEAGH